jgi:putative phosphoribosyl transferase
MKNKKRIKIHVNGIILKADLTIPMNAESVIIFSHGSGSSRLSPRNAKVAEILREKGFATLLCDLLSSKEENILSNRFDLGLLTSRLKSVIYWMQRHKQYKHLKVGLFGASTGAASALKAAADLDGIIGAVVSRGGRPDLASELLNRVNVPVMLIVGELDFEVIRINKNAYKKLTCEKRLVIVPGASHLFQEPGKLEEVTEISGSWFRKHLASFHPSTDKIPETKPIVL